MPFARRLCGKGRPGWHALCGQRSQYGQGTLEYALVAAAFLSVCVALGALWRVLGGGVFVEHALASASHHLQAVSPGAAADVFLF